jgi:hypothetical protein
LKANTQGKRNAFLVLGLFLSIATFLPMSRGGVAVLILSMGAVTYKVGILRPKIVITAGILIVSILVWVPDAVFTRFRISETDSGAQTEGRTRVYAAIIEHLPEYIVMGLGRKDFYGEWGQQTGFYKNDHVSGTHNSFAQVTVYWGLPGLLTLLWFVKNVYKHSPKWFRDDSLRLCVFGVTVAVLLRSLVVHTLYGKEFAIVFGLLTGSSLWIWPMRLKEPMKASNERRRKYRRPVLRGTRSIETFGNSSNRSTLGK